MGAALSAGALEQDCRTCRRVPSVRSRWGCDGPSPVPFAYLTCEKCEGYDPACTLCKGDLKGRPHHDCPNRVLQPDHILSISLQSMFEANGSTPTAEGIMEQTDAWFVSVRLVGAEIAKHREAERLRCQERT